MAVLDGIKHAWNAFLNQNPLNSPNAYAGGFGAGYSGRPDRSRPSIMNERSLISSIYTRIGIDVASFDIRHVKLDDQGRYADDVDSGLNNCLTLEANLDQAATAFRQDAAMSLCENGTICIVPVDTTMDPKLGSFNILTLRVGTITQWYPQHVRVNLYNEKTGRREEIVLEKRSVAIVENPLYSVMNEPNSTLQRLIRKINLLDFIDDQSGSGKLDLIIQLPYVIKNEARKQQAEQRRADIEFQLKDSKYGIAYTDGTEKITQLNRPAENNLVNQVMELKKELYSELGLTPQVMEGTADEATMLNYYNRTITPIITAIIEAMLRSFLTKTARTQKQSIKYFRDPFKLVPISQIAELADKLARNEVVTSNEIRGFMGLKPAKDPNADKLQNSNMPQKADSNVPAPSEPPATPVPTPMEGDSPNG
jgi:hypothetical protein